MKVHPYLNFDGNAEEAFNLYKSVFGGEFLAKMKIKDVPDCNTRPLEEQERIMHIALPIAKDTLLMASDCVPSAGHVLQSGSQTYIMLSPDSKEEADRLFAGLSVEGNIEMEMAEMFWGDYFGSFTDRYGIRWMINYSTNESY